MPRGLRIRNVLRKLVREHLETFLGRRSEAGEPMPGFVVDELRGYVRCGVLAHGAVRFACGHCGHDRLVGLSCKGRGFCPRCMGRRMTEMARHWVMTADTFLERLCSLVPRPRTKVL